MRAKKIAAAIVIGAIAVGASGFIAEAMATAAVLNSIARCLETPLATRATEHFLPADGASQNESEQGESATAQGNGAAKKPIEIGEWSIREALKREKIEFNMLDDEDTFVIRRKTGRGRWHTIFFSSESTKVEDIDVYKVYSVGYIGKKPKSDDLVELLARNGVLEQGSWAMNAMDKQQFPDVWMLVFRMSVPLKADLRKVFDEMAAEADEIEKKMMHGADSF